LPGDLPQLRELRSRTSDPDVPRPCTFRKGVPQGEAVLTVACDLDTFGTNVAIATLGVVSSTPASHMPLAILGACACDLGHFPGKLEARSLAIKGVFPQLARPHHRPSCDFGHATAA